MKRESVKSHVKYEKVKDFIENFNSCKFLNVYQKAFEHMTNYLEIKGVFEITRRSHSNAHILVFGLLISRKWSSCSRSLNLE